MTTFTKRSTFCSRVPSRAYRAPPHPSIIPVLSCPGGHWDLIMGVPPFERCFAVVTSGHFVVKLGYFGTTFEYGHINPEFEWLGEKIFFHQIANTRAEIFANFGLLSGHLGGHLEMTSGHLRPKNANFCRNAVIIDDILIFCHKINKEYEKHKFWKKSEWSAVTDHWSVCTLSIMNKQALNKNTLKYSEMD